jgi:hypothetical protein
MAKRWREVVRLAFKGPRFLSTALELPVLEELLRYQKLVTKTAEALWKADNPGRLPNNFEQSSFLRLTAIESGSAVLPLEALLDEDENPDLPAIEKPLSPVEEAVQIDTAAIQCVQLDRALPDRFPKSVIPLLAEFGKDIQEDGNVIEITPTGGRSVTYTQRERARILDLVEKSYPDTVDVIGTVLAADVKKGRFILYRNPEDPKGIEVNEFAPDQEGIVTEALKEHQTRRLRVKGRGEFVMPEGKLRAITQVEELTPLPTGEIPVDPNERPIWEKLIEIAEQVPEEELAKLPHDMARNVDHYLYGAEKK